MHSISLAIVGVLLVTISPYSIHATTTETAEIEEPKILPLQDAKSVNNDPKLGYSELWQEDDREVLIRNERGAKDNNGQATTTTGKKQNKKDKNQMNNKNVQKHQQHQQQNLNKSPDVTNLDSQNIPNNTPQQHAHQTNVKKHQQKHEKNNNKKHASTEKPKQNDESKNRSVELRMITRDGNIIF